jgi:exodeoxyribonuclease VII small subunit
MPTNNEKSESFKENYDILNEIAKKLRSQDKPDIDALIPMVEQATQAYKHCKQRLDNVKTALKEHLAKEDIDINLSI